MGAVTPRYTNNPAGFSQVCDKVASRGSVRSNKEYYWNHMNFDRNKNSDLFVYYKQVQRGNIFSDD